MIPMMLSVQGCEDDEVIGTLGVIAVVGGAVAIGAAGGGGNGATCHGGYREVCDTSWSTYKGDGVKTHHGDGVKTDHHNRDRDRDRDRDWDRGRDHGHSHRVCRQVYDSCLEYYSYRNTTASSIADQWRAELGLPNEHQQMVNGFAQKTGITVAASEKVLATFDKAKAGDRSAVTDIGLQQSDIDRLAKLSMITDAGVARVASHLDITDSQAQSLLKTLLDEFKTQAADGTSAYWQSCIAQKSWKTPQNLHCEQTYWNGCSPETGATLCLAKAQ